MVHPFIKWVGGKTQLLNDLRKYYPFSHYNNIYKYAEPFVGGGAVLFDILNSFELQEIYISDANSDLINTYQIIRDRPNDIITILQNLQDDYWNIALDKRGYYYSNIRDQYNNLRILNKDNDFLKKAAFFIFLNKTCFNGLYRVNKHGDFNVAIGNYDFPIICEKENILNVSTKLQKIEIVNGDYYSCRSFVDENTFVYLDPPYVPLSSISNTISYTTKHFGYQEQLRLADFFMELNFTGAKLLMSNSNPKNSNEYNDFLEVIYDGFDIKNVTATRSINSNTYRRGRVGELLISNYSLDNI